MKLSNPSRTKRDLLNASPEWWYALPGSDVHHMANTSYLNVQMPGWAHAYTLGGVGVPGSGWPLVFSSGTPGGWTLTQFLGACDAVLLVRG